jgi:acetate CoA/acetoacetate CoA-transferase beta subunit
MDTKNFIARRVAKELNDGDVVNLGIGIPTLVANHLPKDMEVVFQSENGVLGSGPAPESGMEDKDITNAGGFFITVVEGASFFDSATSFGIIRGGHVDMTVLGALQVDEEGNLASWMVPGKMLSGMGGAMDLVVGAKRVIVAMAHTAKGKHKIMKKCTYPMTAVKVVDMIVTEMGVIKVTEEGLELIEIAPDNTVEQVQAVTEASLIVSPSMVTMEP